MRRNLPTISAILYTSKTLANGEHPIMLRVSYNGQRKYKSLGLSCSERLWNENKQEVRLGHPMARNMNTIIRNEIDKANKYVMGLEGKEDYSANSIIKALTKTAPTTHTLFSLFEERIDYFTHTTKKMNTATGYRTLVNIIKRFTGNEDVELFELTKSWAKDFEAYLRTKYTDNSIRKFFDCLKAIMNYAAEKEYIKESPLNNYKFSKDLDCRTRKRALSVMDMHRLMKYYYDTYGMYGDKERPNLETTKVHYWNQKFKPRGTTKLTPIDAEQFSLALYLTSYHFQGLALVDLAHLKRKDLHIKEVVDLEQYIEDYARHGEEYAEAHKEVTEYYEIFTKRAKTNKPTRILCEAQLLIPYLNPFDSCITGDEDEEELNDYVFPIFDKDNDDENAKFGRMTYATYLVNVNLKRVAKKIGLGEGITFYSARHSYASNLYHANVAMGLIAQNMGRNPAEIQTYLKDFDTANIIAANRKALLIGDETYMRIREEKKRKQLQERAEEIKSQQEQTENHE
ncbi:MAG: site-specific integrase [Bacteroidaceae bacterium]|nr:site-specific integrase [Bacteroidaceae bacterium]